MTVLVGKLPRILNAAYYLALFAFFVYITFNQASFDNFLYYSVLPLLVVEFVSFHSSVFLISELSGDRAPSKWQLLKLFLLYSIFVGGMSLVGKNFLLLGHFWISSYAKYSSLRGAYAEEKNFALNKTLFAFLLLGLGLTLGNFFILPFAPPALSWEELAQAAGEPRSSVSGSPPNLISAGLAVYFLLLAISEYHREKIDSKLQSIHLNLHASND